MKDDNQYVYDAYAALAERTIKRMWVAIILLIMSLLTSNAAWIYYESQFEEVTTTQTIEAEQESEAGDNYAVGGDYGTTESEDNQSN